MSGLEATRIAPLEDADRRRFNRVKVNLLGRCLFDNQREFPCQVVNFSPGGASVISPYSGSPGEKVIAYIDHVGRIEGTIVRLIEGGFAMTINASARKRDKLADVLTWLANRHVLNLPEDRRHARKQTKKTDATLTLPDGSSHSVKVIDMSLSGAGLATKLRPEIGTRVELGHLAGRVVRHFDDGFAIEFMRVMSKEAIEETIEKEFF